MATGDSWLHMIPQAMGSTDQMVAIFIAQSGTSQFKPQAFKSFGQMRRSGSSGHIPEN